MCFEKKAQNIIFCARPLCSDVCRLQGFVRHLAREFPELLAFSNFGKRNTLWPTMTLKLFDKIFLGALNVVMVSLLVPHLQNSWQPTWQLIPLPTVFLQTNLCHLRSRTFCGKLRSIDLRIITAIVKYGYRDYQQQSARSEKLTITVVKTRLM